MKASSGTLFFVAIAMLVLVCVAFTDVLGITSVSKSFTSSARQESSAPGYTLGWISSVIPIRDWDGSVNPFRSITRTTYYAVPVTSEGTFQELGTCFRNLLSDFCQ